MELTRRERKGMEPLAAAAPDSATTPTPNLRVVIVHHVSASAAILGPWVVCAPLLVSNIPPIMTLLIIILIALPTITFYQVSRQLRAEHIHTRGAAFTRLGLYFPRPGEILVVGLPALAGAVLLPGLIVWTEPLIRSTLRIPGQLSTGWPAAGTLDATMTRTLLALWVVVAVLIGPLVEEILFRGLLQPLISHSRTRRMLLSTLLFTLYHSWQPWTWPAVFLATIPVAWVRERCGSVLLAACVHILANATAWVLLVNGLMQR